MVDYVTLNIDPQSVSAHSYSITMLTFFFRKEEPFVSLSRTIYVLIEVIQKVEKGQLRHFWMPTSGHRGEVL